MSDDISGYFKDVALFPTVWACPLCGELRGHYHRGRGGCGSVGTPVQMQAVKMSPEAAALLRSRR